MKYTGALGFFDILSYLRRMKIPDAVIQAASDFVEMYGPAFEFLGKIGELEVYLFKFPNEQETGMPFVYLHKEGKPVKVLTDQDAAEIISSFGLE